MRQGTVQHPERLAANLLHFSAQEHNEAISHCRLFCLLHTCQQLQDKRAANTLAPRHLTIRRENELNSIAVYVSNVILTQSTVCLKNS